MKKFPWLLTCFMLLFMVSCNNDAKKSTESNGENADTQQRIISLNGAITETVYDLGLGKELVGRDVTSTYPQEVKDSVKDLGHVRSINMESLMELHPTLILATATDLSPELEKSIQESGISFKKFQQDFSVEGTKNLIKEVAEFVGSTQTQTLYDKIDNDLSKVETLYKKPKVLFVYARGAGTMMVAGTGTPMEEIIELAGAENAVKGITDFKPLTEEALVSSNPDVVLLFETGLESLGGKEGFIKTVPALMQTPAGKNQAIITMDGGLLSDFSPRVGEAAYQLNQLLKPYAK